LAKEIKNNLDILGDPHNKVDPYTVIGTQFLSALCAVLTAVLLLDIYNIVLLAALGFGGSSYL